MFTDEKMEQVYNETHNIKSTLEVLMNTMPNNGITKQELRRANNICFSSVNVIRNLVRKAFRKLCAY